MSPEYTLLAREGYPSTQSPSIEIDVEKRSTKYHVQRALRPTLLVGVGITISLVLLSFLIHASKGASSLWNGNAGFTISERNLSDGSMLFERRETSAKNISLLILSMTYDGSSWGKTTGLLRDRTENDLLDLLATQVDLSETTVGFLTASKQIYEKLKIATENRGIGRTTIIYRQSTTTFDHKDRHADHIQYERRSNLAMIRNILMSRVLEDESHIFWIDSDVIDMTPKLIKTMIQKANANPKEVGLITSRCETANNRNYDLNAWLLDRSVEGILRAVTEDRRGALNGKLIETRKYIPDQTRGLKGDQLARLDSVGGTSLYIQAGLIRKGVNFPPYTIVGTTWGQAGWSAQETEGICYVATQIAGAHCWTLGDSHYTNHTDV